MANRRLSAVEWSGESDQEWALISRLRDRAERLRRAETFMFILPSEYRRNE